MLLGMLLDVKLSWDGGRELISTVYLVATAMATALC